MLWNIILLVVGFILLICGANAFVDGACALAYRFKVPKIIIGLTVVAIGTSIPELAVTMSSVIQGNGGVAVGNVLGSNIANILLILGVASIITPLTVKRKTAQYEIPFVIFITVLLMWFGMQYGEITRIASAVFFGLFLLFAGYLYFTAKREMIMDAEQAADMPLKKIGLLLILGLATLVYGGNITVESAINLANAFGVSSRVIGLTVVAFGTSLPELITCIVAAHKRHVSLILGNIIGSNVFNILWVLGLPALVSPIVFEYNFLIDAAIAVVVTINLWLFAIYRQKITRDMGLFFLFCYFAYLMYLL